MDASSETSICSAITAYQTGEYTSIRKCATAFGVAFTTLQNRLSGRPSRRTGHQHRQILSPTEERTLVRWITHVTNGGFLVSPAFAVEMAEEVRHGRYQISSVPPSYERPIGKRWLDRFRTRHPEIKSVWTRKIERARYTAVSLDTVKTWFEAVTETRLQHQYQLEHVYNMDESGFAIGDSQSSRALINVRENSSWKVIQGRQEWITAIECISASGTAIPPLIIFKA